MTHRLLHLSFNDDAGLMGFRDSWALDHDYLGKLGLGDMVYLPKDAHAVIVVQMELLPHMGYPAVRHRSRTRARIACSRTWHPVGAMAPTG